jgi:hypothetical protein
MSGGLGVSGWLGQGWIASGIFGEYSAMSSKLLCLDNFFANTFSKDGNFRNTGILTVACPFSIAILVLLMYRPVKGCPFPVWEE